jgi:hypothetical protein
VGADKHVDAKCRSDTKGRYGRDIEQVSRADQILTMRAGEALDERHWNPENTRLLPLPSVGGVGRLSPSATGPGSAVVETIALINWQPPTLAISSATFRSRG